jgi:hypothetical protein
VTTLATPNPTSEAAIFGRLWDAADRLTPALARHVLTLGFADSDKARMRDLAERNSGGGLSAGELEELDNYVRVGDLLAILQSKARVRLKRRPGGRNGPG